MENDGHEEEQIQRRTDYWFSERRFRSKTLAPQVRREVVGRMMERFDMSRHACWLVGLSRDSYRHPPEVDEATQARRLYGEAFFGTPASPETKDEVRKALDGALTGVARLAKFSPYICGSMFTAADCVAWVHFFMVGIATEKVLGENLVVKHIPASVDYLKFLEARPQVAKAAAERAAAIAAFMAPK